MINYTIKFNEPVKIGDKWKEEGRSRKEEAGRKK